jgi:hypothetical protein
MRDTNWDTAVCAMERRSAITDERRRMRWRYTVIALGLFMLGTFAGYSYATVKCENAHIQATTK